MAIQFEDLIIDRPLQGIFENSLGDIICGVNQLQNVSIETTSETKDKTDAVGALIMRFFTSKSVEISAENAVFSTSLAALQFGQDREIASNSNKILMPRIFTINTDTIALTGTNKEYQLPDVPAGGVVHINGLTNTGVPDPNKKYKMNTAASETEFTLSEKKLTLPTDITGKIQIKYDREVESGIKLTQSADKFPKTCKFTLSVLVADPCDKETLRHAYIVFPSFQMSPDNTISLNTEDAQSFSGSAQKDYCGANGEMFTIYLSEDDIEEN